MKSLKKYRIIKYQNAKIKYKIMKYRIKNWKKLKKIEKKEKKEEKMT